MRSSSPAWPSTMPRSATCTPWPINWAASTTCRTVCATPSCCPTCRPTTSRSLRGASPTSPARWGKDRWPGRRGRRGPVSIGDSPIVRRHRHSPRAVTAWRPGQGLSTLATNALKDACGLTNPLGVARGNQCHFRGSHVAVGVISRTRSIPPSRSASMQTNVGNLDRIARVVIGLILLQLAVVAGFAVAVAGAHWNHAARHRPGGSLSGLSPARREHLSNAKEETRVSIPHETEISGALRAKSPDRAFWWRRSTCASWWIAAWFKGDLRRRRATASHFRSTRQLSISCSDPCPHRPQRAIAQTHPRRVQGAIYPPPRLICWA